MLKEKRLIVAICVAIVGVILFQTLFYKIVAVLCAILISKRYIKQWVRYKWVYPTLVVVCVIGLWVTSPRIRWNTHDRVRLIYQDEDYNPKNMPLHHWALNTLIPEPEVMNFGLPIVRYGGKILPTGWENNVQGGTLINQFIHGQSIRQFKQGFRNLEEHGQFLASGVVSQAFNTIGGNTRSVYVIRPKHFDKDKTYPVVVFLHGAFGNWQLYQGIMFGLDDYIVISPATHDIDGKWDKEDLNDIVTHQLSFLENIGYKIDRNRVHLVGLSNGAYYGPSEAVRDFSKDFRSVTFIVGEKTTDKKHPHELYIYGKDDAACPNYLKQKNKIQSTDNYLYFPCCGHFLIAYHPKQIRQWLVERWSDIDIRESKATGYINGRGYVDLGLSVKWATCNIGASSPSDYGNYYAWGETKPKTEYTADNSVTYGNYERGKRFEGDPTYDVARANWGGSWRLPTEGEIKELVKKCEKRWTLCRGHKGYIVTGPNGNIIFLPATGHYKKTTLYGADEEGLYWSDYPDGIFIDYLDSDAGALYFNSKEFSEGVSNCWLGWPVRPVSE